MNWVRIFGIIGVTICVSIPTIAGFVVAGETIKWHGTDYVTLDIIQIFMDKRIAFTRICSIDQNWI